MAGLAVVGGNATAGIDLGGAGWVAIDRHGADGGYTPPHEIDHEANLRRLLDAGCDRVLAIASVGGLHPQHGPGSFLCPDDFVSLGRAVTTRSGRDAHEVHGFHPGWRERVVEAWALRVEAPLLDGGIYWEALGPRLETPAEVRVIASDADVVGMTVGSECVVASELGLAYAAICVVVNYANGVGEEALEMTEVDQGADLTREPLARALGAILPALA